MKTQNSLDLSDAERDFSPFLFHLKTVNFLNICTAKKKKTSQRRNANNGLQTLVSNLFYNIYIYTQLY